MAEWGAAMKPTTREEVSASVATTRAALNKLTPQEFAAVHSTVDAELRDWWRSELARVRVRACRSISTEHSGTAAA